MIDFYLTPSFVLVLFKLGIQQVAHDVISK